MVGDITDEFDLNTEKQAVKEFLEHRNVPNKRGDNLLISTWNIEYFGSRKRSSDDYEIIADLIRPFDIAAIQELKSNLTGLKTVLEKLGKNFSTVFTDLAGNSERLAYIYDSDRVKTKELFAELAIPKSKMKEYDSKEIKQKFEGFNRNPFITSFIRKNFDITLANVHIYFGKKSGEEYLRRLAEVYALSYWAKKQVRSKNAYDNDIILIGDMNVPKMDETDKVYQNLTQFGYQPTNWSSKVGTNLNGTDHFDQIVVYPKRTRKPSEAGVLNFDKHLFKNIFEKHHLDPNSKKDLKRWHKYCEKHISDHRPLWASFNV